MKRHSAVSFRLVALVGLVGAGALSCAGSLERPQVNEAKLQREIETLRSEARQQLDAQFARIVTIAYRLRVDGADVCGDRLAPVLGAAIARRNDFLPPPYSSINTNPKRPEGVDEAIGAADQVRVFFVVAGSPAEEAGLAVGDVILSVDGGSTDKASDVFERLRGAEGSSSTLRVRRGDQELTLALPHLRGCDAGVVAFVSTSTDTQPEPKHHDIGVPTGLVRFCRDDDELAIAIAHQLAHQVLGTPYPRNAKDEPPADRLGLFMAARAGFDVSKAPAFWDRLAAEQPWKIQARTTNSVGSRLWHTGMALRAPVIRQTVAEILAAPRPTPIAGVR